MNIVAIAANVAQLVIILAIFYVRGLELGTAVIFLLFLLMPIPFVNVLVLLFAKRPMRMSAADGRDAGPIIKREAFRISYPEDRCPVLSTGGATFAVMDLSEGGVRINASSTTPFKKKITGEIQLLSGERIRFKAALLRREDGETTFQFTDPIGTAALLAEKKLQSARYN
ncbi:MAG TPA: PilZ domain-containing protein [Desulfosarcina sp.]|nr:PilZ domain-containing protein [Desulfosarcina sp.]